MISSDLFWRVLGYAPTWLLYLHQEYQQVDDRTPQNLGLQVLKGSGTTVTTWYFVVQSSVWKHWPRRNHPKALGFFQTQSLDLMFVLKQFFRCLLISKISYMGLFSTLWFGSNFTNFWDDFRFENTLINLINRKQYRISTDFAALNSLIHWGAKKEVPEAKKTEVPK